MKGKLLVCGFGMPNPYKANQAQMLEAFVGILASSGLDIFTMKAAYCR